jgi:hypothetical protein
LFKRLFETFAFFKAFFADIAGFLIPVTLPVVVIETYLTFLGMEVKTFGLIHWLPFIIGFLYRPIYTGGLIWLISKAVEGSPWSLSECMKKGVQCWKSLINVYIISLMLIFAGLMAFIVPGVIIMARVSLAEFNVVLEGMNPRGALFKSNEQIKGTTGTVIGCTMLLMFLLVGLDMITSYFLRKISIQGFIPSVVATVVFMVLSSTVTILFYRFYDLAKKRETVAARSPEKPEL